MKDLEHLTPNTRECRRNLSLTYQVVTLFSALAQVRFVRLPGAQVVLLAFPMAALLWKQPGERTGQKDKSYLIKKQACICLRPLAKHNVVRGG